MSTAILLCVLLSGVLGNPQYGPGSDSDLTLSETCGHPEYECTVYYQCENGFIITDGGGLIDLRTKRTSECYNPIHPDAPSVCCKIPGTHVTDPVDQCQFPYTCVNHYECVLPSGNPHTSFVNTGKTHDTCWANDGGIGVCCHPQPLDICPATSICVPENDCTGGQGYDWQNQFSQFTNSHAHPWHSCLYDGHNYGVCCNAPIIDHCPGGSNCVEEFVCQGDALEEYSTSNYLRYQHGGRWARCSLTGYDNGGVCCSSRVIDQCPGNSFCVEKFECLGDALVQDTTDNFLRYAPGAQWANCAIHGGHNEGICCEQPIKQCPVDSFCVYEDRCLGSALDRRSSYNPYGGGSSVGWTSCYVNDFDPGVCCQPPYIIDICPGRDSSCVPFENCKVKDKVMDYHNVYNPKPNHYTDDIAQCQIDQHTNGICCEPTAVIDIPPATQCGVRNYDINTRITTGGHPKVNEAQFGELPWQAIVFDRDYTFIGGGTLISNSFIVTAAHRIAKYKAGDLRIRLGEWQVNSFDEPYPYLDVDVDEIIIHEHFNPKTVVNGIALIRLAYRIDFNYHINALCLPDQGYHYVPPPNTKCIASGWGKDSFQGTFQHILKLIELPYVDHGYCQTLLRDTRLGSHFILDPSFVCAGGEANKDACEGDGGGPLACYDDASQSYVLVGITAWGIGCGNLNVPGVYVNVPYYGDWIRSITGYDSTNQPVYGK